MTETETPILSTLYILMRNDMKSMNPGKAMAQASHASNAFIAYMEKSGKLADYLTDKKGSLCRLWQKETPQGFGTVLVLGVNEEEMHHTIDHAGRNNFVSDIVTDPTYPTLEKFGPFSEIVGKLIGLFGLKLRRSVTFSSEDTCAYIFGDRNDPILKAILSDFDLHP